jgi:peptidoglycan/LPS O-acetylase OafA/YrhL
MGFAEARVNVQAYRFPLLDSVRGIALLAVVVAHSSFFMSIGGSDSLSHLRFDFSVRLFFMVSAFLLYRPWVRARLAEWDSPSVAAFAWRRFLRILPAYYVALTVITLWLGLPLVFSTHGIWTFYGLVQVYQPGWAVGGLTQAWTLNVEVVFYAFLPLWGALMRRIPAASNRLKLRQELIGCALLLSLSFVYKVAITATDAIDGVNGVPLQLNTLTFLDDFAIGMALGVLSAYYEGRSDVPRWLRMHDLHPGIAWGVGLGLLGVTSVAVGFFGRVAGDISGPPYVERHYLLALIAVTLMLPATFGDPERGFVRRHVLSSRVLGYLGMISYGIYLWHFAVLLQLQRWGFGDVAAVTGQWIWFPAALAGGTLLATISWYVVEKPVSSLRRLVKPRPAPQPGEAIEEPMREPAGMAR